MMKCPIIVLLNGILHYVLNITVLLRYIPLSDDKHQKVRDSSKKCTGNPRQIQSENFFPVVGKKFFSD